MTKLCACGCGKLAPIAKRTDQRRGCVQGQPRRFIYGHSARICNLRHGGASQGQKTPEYKAYCNAKRRCTNSKHHGWQYYGGRGIKFLFSNFEQFLASLGLRPNPQLTVDRIDNNSHYMPGNVHWATRLEQRRNSRPRQRRAAKDRT